MTLAFALAFLREMGLGLVLGLAGGFAIVRLVNRLDLESGLYPIVVLAASLVLFGIAGVAPLQRLPRRLCRRPLSPATGGCGRRWRSAASRTA